MPTVAGPSNPGWLMRNRAGLIVGVLATVILAGGFWFLQRPAPPPVVIQAPTPRPTASPPPITPLTVYVGGEVARPGVYQLSPAARVYEAVNAAGGMTEGADPDRINLAARLADGQQVSMPRKAEPRASPGVAKSSTVAGRLNINLASVAELDSLPGVGPVSAQRIVAYREQNGLFTRIEQLREAKLVHNATFDRIRELISV